MNKKLYIQILAVGLVITLLTFFIRVDNPICNYSNSMSQEEMAAEPGYLRGYPFHYVSEPAWQCSESGETGKGYIEPKLTFLINFLGDWFVWFSVSFTLYSLSKSVRKKR